MLPWRCGVLAEFKAALAKLLGHAPRQVLFRDHLAGDGTARRSVSGELRAPVCGMGICQECRVWVDGVRQLACQTTCRAGMRVEVTQ